MKWILIASLRARLFFAPAQGKKQNFTHCDLLDTLETIQNRLIRQYIFNFCKNLAGVHVGEFVNKKLLWVFWLEFS